MQGREEHPAEFYDPDIATEPEQVGFLRRIARGVINKVFPYQLEPYDPGQYVDLDQSAMDAEAADKQTSQPEPSPLLALSLAPDGSFHIKGPNMPDQPLHTALNSQRLFLRLATVYIPNGEGQFTVGELAKRSNYSYGTIRYLANQLDFLPSEIVTMLPTSAGLQLKFGNLALSSMVPEESDEYSKLKQKPRHGERQTANEINRGKTDLTTQDHAIINAENQQFYLPLQSAEAIMAGRVIESLSLWQQPNPQSADIARLVWLRMTTTERAIFQPNKRDVLLSEGAAFIEIPVLNILRRLTNRLMLTLEPRGDRFTIIAKGFTIEYHDQALSEETIAGNPELRPILPPTEVTENLSAAKQREYSGLARLYMQRARRREPLEDEEALSMLDFIMSSAGHWAIRENCGRKGVFNDPGKAIHIMHKYLRRNFHGYSPAYRDRLISGNRSVRRRGTSGGVRQVSGRLPQDSKWVLGNGIRELFNEASQPDDSSNQ
jgi:hypothetical protein